MKTSYKPAIIFIGFNLLILIAFSRPIITMFAGRTSIPINKIIPTGFAYVTILLLLISAKNIKINLATLLMFVFSGYGFLSLIWGSLATDLIELILPFVYYLGSRTFVTNPKKSRIIVTAMIAGYMIPIVGSALLIVLGKSVLYTMAGTSAVRQYGVYKGAVHTAAHAMVIFTIIYAIYLTYKSDLNYYVQLIIHFLFILSMYCLWNTFVRSAYVAFFTFWVYILFRWNKKYFTIFLVLLSLFGLMNASYIETLFWKDDVWYRERNIETASSNRTVIWSHNLGLFMQEPIYVKILGKGAGAESKFKTTQEDLYWNSHNDFISLLVTLGLIGSNYFIFRLLVLF